MTDESVPKLPEKIAASRSDKFSQVTKVGNDAVAALTKSLEKGPDAITAAIKSTVPLVLQTAIEVTFERAKIWSKIDTVEDLQFYSKLDYDAWVTPPDPNASELKQVQVYRLVIYMRLFFLLLLSVFSDKIK